MTAKNLITFDEEYYYQDAAKYYGLRVPLDFGYNFSVAPQINMAVATGPYINFNLYARQQLSPNLECSRPVAGQENKPFRPRLETSRCRLVYQTEHDIRPRLLCRHHDRHSFYPFGKLWR